MDDIDKIANKGWFNRANKEYGGCVGVVVYIILVLCLVFMCSSCSTKTKIEYRDRIVDNYITKVVHDTLKVEVKDSTHHSVVQKGDTIYDTKYIERTRWRDRIVEKCDTCWRDSIVTEYKEVTKEVVKIPKIYHYAMIFSILCIIFVAIKLYVKFKVI